MYEWIQEHNKVLSVLISFGTLLVWLVYAQLLYSSYRRQVRPRIVINRGRHRNLNALCIIGNMSAEAVFVEYILARLETSRGTVLEDVTELEQYHEQGDENRDALGDPPPSLRDSTRQGPLGSGDFVHIGTFQGVIRRTLRNQRLEGDDNDEPVRLKALTIQVVAIYGSDDLPISVERRFLMKHGEQGHRLVPASWDSRRRAGWWDRRRLHKTMERLRREQLADD